MTGQGYSARLEQSVKLIVSPTLVSFQELHRPAAEDLEGRRDADSGPAMFL